MTSLAMDHPAFHQAVGSAKSARRERKEWSARARLGVVLGCSLGSWALVLGPYIFWA